MPTSKSPTERKRPARWMYQVIRAFQEAYLDGDWRKIAFDSATVLLRPGREIHADSIHLPVRIVLELHERQYMARIRREPPAPGLFAELCYVLFTLPVDSPTETRLWATPGGVVKRLIMTPVDECFGAGPVELASSIGDAIWRNWWRDHGGDDTGREPPWQPPPFLEPSKNKVSVS